MNGKKFDIIEKCVICGKEFKKTGNQNTCSRKCSQLRKRNYNRKYNKKYYEENKNSTIKHCTIFGKEFNSINGKTICNSENCKKERDRQYIDSYREKNNIKVENNRKCEVCGKEFKRKHKETVCSDKCRIEKNRRYQENYYLNVTLPKRKGDIKN